MSISVDRAAALLEKFKEQKILVYGDLMLDRYIHGDVSRISPEAPVPVVHVNRNFSVPGGACNVASNIVSLGGKSSLSGVIGDDTFGDELMGLLITEGVDTAPILVSEEVTTVVKTRIIADQQQVCRVDREELNHADVSDTDAYRSSLCSALKDGCSGVIIEDYGKGSIQQSTVTELLKEAKEHNIPVGYDPKENHTLEVKGITVATPNRKEAFIMSKGKDESPLAEPLNDPCLKESASILYHMFEPEFLMLTLGSQGMLLVEPGETLTHVPTRAREVFDVSGAGDTVIATCLLALASGASHREAAELANFAAGVVVATLGTATCSPEKLLAAVEQG